MEHNEPSEKDPQKIDLLRHHPKILKAPYKRPKKRRIFWGKSLIIYPLIVLGIIFAIGAVRFVANADATSKEQTGLNLFSQIKRLVLSDDKPEHAKENDRINVLLVGIGGAGHDGAYLTDTIMVASIKQSSQDVSIFSIPRDLLVPVPGYNWRKINSVYALGIMKDSDTALDKIGAVVENVLDIPIHYHARIDFKGFEKAIDAVGGIEVTVDRSFVDEKYPVEDGTGEVTVVAFDKGDRKMNGATALTYARSRHGTNGEGSDFARAARQQKILMAFKSELFSFSTLLSSKRISKLLDVVEDHFETDLSLSEMMHLASNLKNLEAQEISTYVFDTSPSGFLVNSKTEDGAFVLIPPNYSFSEMQSFVKTTFTVSSRKKEGARIVVQNSTSIEGLANITKEALERNQFDVVRVENSPLRDLESTIIYDLTAGKKQKSISDIQNQLHAKIAPIIPDFLQNYEDTDIVVVLGRDQEGLVAGERAQAL